MQCKHQNSHHRSDIDFTKKNCQFLIRQVKIIVKKQKNQVER